MPIVKRIVYLCAQSIFFVDIFFDGRFSHSLFVYLADSAFHRGHCVYRVGEIIFSGRVGKKLLKRYKRYKRYSKICDSLLKAIFVNIFHYIIIYIYILLI